VQRSEQTYTPASKDSLVLGKLSKAVDTLSSGLKQSERKHPDRDSWKRNSQSASNPNLTILDARFHSWLESEYHRSPHRGLGKKTPLDAWLEKARHIIPIDPLMMDAEKLFFHQVSRKVYKDSTITLDGVFFEVPSALIGEWINLYYNPHLAPQRRRLLINHKDSSFLVDDSHWLYRDCRIDGHAASFDSNIQQSSQALQYLVDSCVGQCPFLA